MTWQWGGEGGEKWGASSDAEPRGWALWEHGSQARGVNIIGRADRACAEAKREGIMSKDIQHSSEMGRATGQCDPPQHPTLPFPRGATEPNVCNPRATAPCRAYRRISGTGLPDGRDKLLHRNGQRRRRRSGPGRKCVGGTSGNLAGRTRSCLTRDGSSTTGASRLRDNLPCQIERSRFNIAVKADMHGSSSSIQVTFPFRTPCTRSLFLIWSHQARPPDSRSLDSFSTPSVPSATQQSRHGAPCFSLFRA
jgi:hypothetical protein